MCLQSCSVFTWYGRYDAAASLSLDFLQKGGGERSACRIATVTPQRRFTSSSGFCSSRHLCAKDEHNLLFMLFRHACFVFSKCMGLAKSPCCIQLQQFIPLAWLNHWHQHTIVLRPTIRIRFADTGFSTVGLDFFFFFPFARLLFLTWYTMCLSWMFLAAWMWRSGVRSHYFSISLDIVSHLGVVLACTAVTSADRGC